VTVFGGLEPADAAAAHAAGLELGGVDLQDLFVDLTSKHAKEGAR
jgi:ABC-2 type transport system ATP-binding protein